MRHPQDLTREELVTVVERIRLVLYAGGQAYRGEIDPGTDHPGEVVETWDPGREWESDEIDDVAHVLADYDLVPTEAGIRAESPVASMPLAAPPAPELGR